MQDLIGKKFGRLTVVARADNDMNGNIRWVCKCDCGNIKEKPVYTSSLTSGRTRSCGCLVRNSDAYNTPRHGLSDTRLYTEYISMRRRCYAKNRPQYKNYGQRGISVCKEWDGDFVSFYNWAISNGYSDELTLDRIDVNGNYCPENCRWATPKEQANNKRTNHIIEIDGVAKTISEWADICGISPITIRTRLNRGWFGKELLSPLRRRMRENA